MSCIEQGMQRTFVSRYVTFNEEEFPMKQSAKIAYVDQNHTESKDDFIEVELSGTESRVPEKTKDVDMQESEPSQAQVEAPDYQLVRDRSKRTIEAPQRFGYADMVSYAFVVASSMEYDECTSVKEAMRSKESTN